MFERRDEPVLDTRRWHARVGRSVMAAGSVIAVSLLTGVLGYRYLGDLGWIDALLNASMILGGMGPVDHIDSTAGKLFASAYSLFSGVVFIGTAGVLVAPWAHRMLHRFHADLDSGSRKRPAKGEG